MSGRTITAAEVAKLERRASRAALNQAQKRAVKQATVALYGVAGDYQVRIMEGDAVMWRADVPTVRMGNILVKALRAHIATFATWS